MDCDEISDEDELAVDVYGVFIANGIHKSYSERNIIKLLDDLYEEPGYTESKLRKINKTLAQVLQNSKDFRNCGRSEWKAIPAGGQMDNIHDSISGRPQ
ncbi:unnamed protein product [Caenorhabditis nigoni]